VTLLQFEHICPRSLGRSFREVIENEAETRELDEKAQKYGYITIVSLESVENATVLAA